MANFILFGGTFDPIHNGHIRIALEASLRLNANVIFIPAKSPRWKTPLTSTKDRLAMLKLALKYCPSGSTIDEFELSSDADINYTIDTVRHFKAKYPNDKLYLIIGGDQVNLFPKWKNAEEIAKNVTVLFVSRPDIDIDENIVKTYNMLNLRFDGSGEVSSTKVRNLESLDIPKEVLLYIEKNRLYFASKLEKMLDEHRLNHSFEVANLGYSIAKANHLNNPDKYYIAGLLHDLGKTTTISYDDVLDIMHKNYAEYLSLPPFSYHQFLGEYLAKKYFNITDEDILMAIKFHCTGNKDMSPLAMVVYASDKIEPTRGFDSTFLISSCMRNYKQGFIDTLIDNKKYLLNHNKDILNPLTDACFKMYLPKENL